MKIMLMTFNINHEVKVKLTDAGRDRHRKLHDDFLKDFPLDVSRINPPPALLARAAALDYRTLRDAFGRLLIKAQIRAILERRDLLLATVGKRKAVGAR